MTCVPIYECVRAFFFLVCVCEKVMSSSVCVYVCVCFCTAVEFVLDLLDTANFHLLKFTL